MLLKMMHQLKTSGAVRRTGSAEWYDGRRTKDREKLIANGLCAGLTAGYAYGTTVLAVCAEPAISVAAQTRRSRFVTLHAGLC